MLVIMNIRNVPLLSMENRKILAQYITSNLKISKEIISKNNGKNSIQIDALLQILNQKEYKSLKSFSEKYGIEYDRKNKVLKNFKLFIIMDTDDCSEETKRKYMSGTLFSGHILKDYIVPIFNIKNLEEVMEKAGIITRKIERADKTSFYRKIFPIDGENGNIDGIWQIKNFAKRIKHIENTNLLELIEYCFECLPNENLWDEGGEKELKAEKKKD